MFSFLFPVQEKIDDISDIVKYLKQRKSTESGRDKYTVNYISETPICLTKLTNNLKDIIRKVNTSIRYIHVIALDEDGYLREYNLPYYPSVVYYRKLYNEIIISYDDFLREMNSRLLSSSVVIGKLGLFEQKHLAFYESMEFNNICFNNFVENFPLNFCKNLDRTPRLLYTITKEYHQIETCIRLLQNHENIRDRIKEFYGNITDCGLYCIKLKDLDINFNLLRDTWIEINISVKFEFTDRNDFDFFEEF